jgi:hypothetical protein
MAKTALLFPPAYFDGIDSGNPSMVGAYPVDESERTVPGVKALIPDNRQLTPNRLRGKPASDAQPLKGHLISKSLRHR